MRQYASREQSGTMMNSQRAPEPLDNVIDRVMAIAQRVVKAELVIKNQAKEITDLTEKLDKLTNKVENMALKATGQEFKKPTTRRTTKTTEA